MNGDRSSGVGSRLERSEARARESEARATEENAERFARALAPHVTAQYRLPVAPTPGSWRPSDGVLTPDATGSSPTTSGVTNATAEPGSAESDRLVVSVKTGDLGELSLVLDRSSAGVRVVVGVADAHAADAMLPERDALLRQLEASGLRIESLQIVRQSDVGTVLAPLRSLTGPRGPNQRPTDAEREERESTRRRGSRKLNLVG